MVSVLETGLTGIAVSPRERPTPTVIIVDMSTVVNPQLPPPLNDVGIIARHSSDHEHSFVSKVRYFQYYHRILLPSFQGTLQHDALRSSSSLPICVPTRKTAMTKSKLFSSVASDPQIFGINCQIIFQPFPLFLLSGRDSSTTFFRVPFLVIPRTIHWHHVLWCQLIHRCNSGQTRPTA